MDPAGPHGPERTRSARSVALGLDQGQGKVDKVTRGMEKAPDPREKNEGASGLSSVS